MLLTGTSAASLGDIFGFTAVILAGASAFFMVMRGKILKKVKKLSITRGIHIAISTLAGLFIILHVSFFITYPINIGVILGYVAFAIAIVVWLTGTAFLEMVKDSLIFHSSLSIVLIAVILMHAASTSVNIPSTISEIILVSTVAILLTNMSYQVLKVK